MAESEEYPNDPDIDAEEATATDESPAAGEVPESHSREVPVEASGQRIDRVAALLFPDYSRSRLKAWLEGGQLLVDGTTPRARDPAVTGQLMTLTPPGTAEVTWKAEAVSFEVLFEDDDIVVVNKPAELVVHPGAGNARGTLVNGLLQRYPELERLPRGGIVHRLDKDTTGVMVVARSERAHSSLVEGLRERTVSRIYEAVANGSPTGGGRVDAPIGRHRTFRTRMAVDPMGRPSATRYEVLERFGACTRLRVHLETGRTHQIRVHMAHINMPLLGDRTYGRGRIPAGLSPELIDAIRGFPRQALHAARLVFDHPGTGEPVEFKAQAPADYRALLDLLRGQAQ